LEDTRIDFDLFNARAIELFECCDYTCFFPGTGGTVDEEMREIA
jgi:predicted Rossmann-fold nucleotide-binding protein